MVSLVFLFWMLVALFGVIGAMRGWAKELLVTFGVILALFIATVIEKFIPFVSSTIQGTSLFWLRVMIVMALVFFGYQGPNIPKLAGGGRFARERLQDSLLGLFLGAINGYLIFGTLWFFINEAKYPFPVITAPVPGTTMGDAAARLIAVLPPHWLGAPAVYFAVALAFVFVLVVFI